METGIAGQGRRPRAREQVGSTCYSLPFLHTRAALCNGRGRSPVVLSETLSCGQEERHLIQRHWCRMTATLPALSWFLADQTRHAGARAGLVLAGAALRCNSSRLENKVAIASGIRGVAVSRSDFEVRSESFYM
ncbi:hypothetical protein J6590_066912 [Homalodisca vitripennis]|nr:hypothetical protein J6590_066912 [Homalodisca vitripennis]